MLSGFLASWAPPPTPMPAASMSTLLIGTPSITYSGWLLALSDVPPRIKICELAPGSPLLSVTLSPAARPDSMLFTLGTTPTSATSAEMEETDPVMASRRCVP